MTLPNNPKEKAALAHQARYAFRELHGLCRFCGGPRQAKGASEKHCAACLQYFRERKRVEHKAKQDSGEIVPHGPAVKVGIVKQINVRLDRQMLVVFDELRRQYRVRYPDERWTISRMVRDIIHRDYEGPFAFVPLRDRYHIYQPDLYLRFSVGPGTLALIDRHAARTSKGDRSKTVRAMLEAAARAHPDSPLRRVTQGYVRNK